MRGGSGSISASWKATESLATSMVHSRPRGDGGSGPGEQFDGLAGRGVAAAAVREAAVTVVGGLVTVEGDADLDPGLLEEVEIAGLSCRPVVWMAGRGRPSASRRCVVTRKDRPVEASPSCSTATTEGEA